MSNQPIAADKKPTPQPKAFSSPRTSASQRITSIVVDSALVLLAFWVLSGFFGALAWAVVLTLATWPLYDRFRLLF